MGFKDILKRDLETTFFNLGEFAERHKFNNNVITAVIDDDTLMAKYSSEFESLPKGSHCIMTPIRCFAEKPAVNSAVRFDGGLYVIDEISEEAGMYIIFLARGTS